MFLFISGLLSGWEIHSHFNFLAPSIREKHEGQFEFINPLLECVGSEELISQEVKSFKDKLAALIDTEIKKKKTANVAVYFRDLDDGPWFGINEGTSFAPASLLKVPIMMGYLKKAESEPGLLKTKIKFDRVPPPFSQYFETKDKMEYGKSYTVEELLFRMIVYSDNYATHLLMTFDKEDLIDDAYKELGIPDPYKAGASYEIAVAEYASFFRILYNASYLNKEMSNRALKMLSNVDFPGGIRAGLPANVPVAQKFGERELDKGQRQLHDCGIIYYPGSPYLLCVMTKGTSFEDLDHVITDISRTAYEEVDSQMRIKLGKAH